MILQELFDRPLPYQWDKSSGISGDNVVSASFTVGDIEYGIEFDMYEPNNWDVNFSYYDAKTKKHQAGITGTRGEIAVFSTAIAIIKEFTNKFNPQTLAFSATEPSRQRLYDRIIRVLAQGGWESETEMTPKGKTYVLHNLGWKG